MYKINVYKKTLAACLLVCTFAVLTACGGNDSDESVSQLSERIEELEAQLEASEENQQGSIEEESHQIMKQ